MKLMIISDIHGAWKDLEIALNQMDKEGADQLVILGDILYHGPRNPLPKDYDPMIVVKLLNGIKDKIIAIRGNCDSHVDQMVLEFPILSDYSWLMFEGKKFFLSHGHIYNESNMPSISSGDALFYGHTHIPETKTVNGITFFNPGSIALPKEGHPKTYGIFDQNTITVKTMLGEVYKSISL